MSPSRPDGADATPREAWMAGQQAVDLDAAVGRLAAEPVIPYPPVVAAVVPGERLDGPLLERLGRMAHTTGVRLTGCADAELRTIRVVAGEGEARCR